MKKTIIVLTDFSKTARNAANNAVEIAKQMNADILLLNSYLMPFAIFSAEAEGRSIVDSSIIKEASENGLKKEARRLQRLINLNSNDTEPAIKTISSIDSLQNAIHLLAKNTQLCMIVMGSHQTLMPILFSSIHMDTLLQQIKHPLLIVPTNCSLFPIKNFVFATDLDQNNISVLNKIVPYTKLLKFHLNVCHVADPVFIPDFNEEDKIDEFNLMVTKLAVNNVSFTNLTGSNASRTLKKYTQNIKADIMGIIYNPHSFIWKLFHQSNSNQFIKNQKLPLLIFPKTF